MTKRETIEQRRTARVQTLQAAANMLEGIAEERKRPGNYARTVEVLRGTANELLIEGRQLLDLAESKRKPPRVAFSARRRSGSGKFAPMNGGSSKKEKQTELIERETENVSIDRPEDS